MSDRIVTRAEVRQVDRCAIEDWGVSSLVLMENAGRGVADLICDLGVRGDVVVACAKGNNGGDGFVLARHLRIRNVKVEVLLCADADELVGDARANFELLQRTSVPIHVVQGPLPQGILRNADWIVDALLGTGARGAPRAPLAAVIETLNLSSARRLAVDLPSGLDCDSGAPSRPTFRADHTCTFVAMKPGLVAPDAQPYVGQVHVADIGLPWELVERVLNQT